LTHHAALRARWPLAAVLRPTRYSSGCALAFLGGRITTSRPYPSRCAPRSLAPRGGAEAASKLLGRRPRVSWGTDRHFPALPITLRSAVAGPSRRCSGQLEPPRAAPSRFLGDGSPLPGLTHPAALRARWPLAAVLRPPRNSSAAASSRLEPRALAQRVTPKLT